MEGGSVFVWALLYITRTPTIFFPCMQEANVCMAVGSNDEVYPISRNDLEAAVGVFRGFHGWKTMTTRDEVHATLEFRYVSDSCRIHSSISYFNIFHVLCWYSSTSKVLGYNSSLVIDTWPNTSTYILYLHILSLTHTVEVIDRIPFWMTCPLNVKYREWWMHF